MSNSSISFKPERQTMKQYSLKNFAPLIIIFSLIMFITMGSKFYYNLTTHDTMRIFMASFFLIFGFFKIINLAGFAKAYSIYDIIAKKYFWYGYVYPFLEISLGLAYLYNWQPVFTNIFTLILMLVSAAGVFNELKKGKHITCACLGVLFTIPMTYVTLAEDMIMALMALIMLLSANPI